VPGAVLSWCCRMRHNIASTCCQLAEQGYCLSRVFECRQFRWFNSVLQTAQRCASDDPITGHGEILLLVTGSTVLRVTNVILIRRKAAVYADHQLTLYMSCGNCGTFKDQQAMRLSLQSACPAILFTMRAVLAPAKPCYAVLDAVFTAKGVVRLRSIQA
jgi:hypothetical protein